MAVHGPSHDQVTVNSSVSELEDPKADDQVVSLLSKLRASRPSSLASHTLSGSGLRLIAYARKTSRLFPFYALRFLCTGNYAGIIDASLAAAHTIYSADRIHYRIIIIPKLYIIISSL